MSQIYRYRLYGLPVESEHPLPLPADDAAPSAIAWRFVYREPAGGSPPVPDDPPIFLRAPGGDLQFARFTHEGSEFLWNRGVGAFELLYEQRTIRIDPHPDADPKLLDQILIGQIPVMILRSLGYLTLHASAVNTTSGCAAFLGTHGQGKSTMAACFLQHGAELITDDMLPVRGTASGVECIPAVPMMKVWPQTLGQNLQVERDLPPVMQGSLKRLFVLDGEYPFATAPVPLRCAYLLEPFDPAAGSAIEISRLSPREGLQMLLAHTSWRQLMGVDDAGRALSLYGKLAAGLPLKRLRFPRDFRYQPEVRAQILADLTRHG